MTLLPCPFCGGPASTRADESSDYRRNWSLEVGCFNRDCPVGPSVYPVGAHADGVCESAKQSAANAWNTRTAADRAVLAELLDELEVNQAGYDMAGPQGAMGPGTCPEGVTGPRRYRMQVDLGDVLRAADPLGPIGNAELSTPDKFLLPSIVERDRLWCQALIATLSVKDIAKVTTMFNKLRPD